MITGATPGETYTLSLWGSSSFAYSPYGDVNPQIDGVALGLQTISTTSVVDDPEWEELTWDFVAPAASFELTLAGYPGYVFIDDVHLTRQVLPVGLDIYSSNFFDGL